VVKLDGGKRESDGVVVPLIAGMNPWEGRTPTSVTPGNGGERDGMTGAAPSIYPRGSIFLTPRSDSSRIGYGLCGCVRRTWVGRSVVVRPVVRRRSNVRGLPTKLL
jgi:hypothetical protein